MYIRSRDSDVRTPRWTCTTALTWIRMSATHNNTHNKVAAFAKHQSNSAVKRPPADRTESFFAHGGIFRAARTLEQTSSKIVIAEADSEHLSIRYWQHRRLLRADERDDVRPTHELRPQGVCSELRLLHHADG